MLIIWLTRDYPPWLYDVTDESNYDHIGYKWSCAFNKFITPFCSLKKGVYFYVCFIFSKYCIITLKYYYKIKSYKQKDITMSFNKTLLPKSVSDSCYASLTQIYIDIFEVSPTSHLSLSTRNQRRITAGCKVHSPEKPNKKLFDVVHLDKCDQKYEWKFQ